MTKQLATDLAVVRQGRVLFSHHSVGANILAGIQRLDTETPVENKIRVTSLEEAVTAKEAMLIHFSGGQNGDPKSKIDAFSSTIRGNKLLKPDLAFMKFCYVDFNPQTNIDDLFSYYQNTIQALKRENPGIRFAHVTVPLTERPTGLKWRIFRLIGKEVWDDQANMKRAEFNRRLKESFSSDPAFDLARIESTEPDGRMTTFVQDGQNYPSLYSGYTEDGGHLNTLGQQMAGETAIRFMAEALKSHNTTR